MAAKKSYVAYRTERVGRGNKNIDLVAGEPVEGLTDDEAEVLLDSQQIYDASGEPGTDVYSQEYRDLHKEAEA